MTCVLKVPEILHAERDVMERAALLVIDYSYLPLGFTIVVFENGHAWIAGERGWTRSKVDRETIEGIRSLVVSEEFRNAAQHFDYLPPCCHYEILRLVGGGLSFSFALEHATDEVAPILRSIDRVGTTFGKRYPVLLEEVVRQLQRDFPLRGDEKRKGF